MDNRESPSGQAEVRPPQDAQSHEPQAESPDAADTQSTQPPGVTAPADTAESMEAVDGELPSAQPLTAGQIVNGLIVHMDEQGALVDAGTKSEGHVSAADLSGSTTEEGRPLAVGDRVPVYIVRPEDDDGAPVLSKKRADYELIWQHITEAHKEGEVLTAMVTDRVKGGLVVDLGMRGFLPASHVRTRNVHALDRFVGQSVKVKIIEVDRGRKRVVVSQKDAIEQARRFRRERTLASLEESKVYRGIVRRITDYGAFVDLGGVDGLLHITEMSWTRIRHPSDVVKVGDKIDVMVLRYDREKNRISLGLKQILPDPWSDVGSQFSVGRTVTGTVSRVVPFGAFVRLEGGIEGIIPNSELPGGRGQRSQDTLSEEQSVQVKIVSIQARERRMTLSLRQVEQARERRELKEYLARQEADSRVTIGDLFGSILAETQAAQGRVEEAGEEAAAAIPEDAEGATVSDAESPETEAREPKLAAQADIPEVAEQAADAEPGGKVDAAGCDEGAAEETESQVGDPVGEKGGTDDSAKSEVGSSAGTWSSSESPAESEAAKD